MTRGVWGALMVWLMLVLPLQGQAPPHEPPEASALTPRAALDGLLAEEAALSAAAATKSPAAGIASLLAADGVLITRDGPVTGPASALERLRENPPHAGTRARWRAIRGGLSADGRHGFTLGYLDIDGAVDAAAARRRYLAYWVRGADGWRVAAFKQTLRSAGEVDAPQQPPALPARLVPPDPARTAGHVATLKAAEQSFSDRAQEVGIKQSFQEYGRADAIHLFGEAGFALDLAAIGRNHDKQPAGPSRSHWSADTAIVASSGDLGVTIGYIVANAPPTDGRPARVPFFTIWRRDDVNQPWRYVAE
jgi:ketosteroid isomerase-like protein